MNDDLDDYRKRMQEKFLKQQGSKNESGIFGALFQPKDQPQPHGAEKHQDETDHELAARLQAEYDKEDREPGTKNGQATSIIDFRTLPMSSSIEMNPLRGAGGGRKESQKHHYSTVETSNPRLIQSQRVAGNQGGNFFEVWKNKIFAELDPMGRISFICMLVLIGLILLLILASL